MIVTFLKGMAMGAADVIPGVSGGTIAFITGIYQRLLIALSSIGPALWPLFRTEGFAAVWRRMDGAFLLALFSGVLTSIVLLASLISHLLATYPHLLWGFFFGLILGSAIFILRVAGTISPVHWVVLLASAVIAWLITDLTPVSIEPNVLNLFVGGVVAISAMILPGLSGSFLLLMFGLYPPIMDAIKTFDFEILGVFAAGCVVGLLLFSRVLSYLMARYYTMLMVALTGLMLGALNKVWPWKETVSYRTNSHGEETPLVQINVGPAEFAEVSGLDPQILAVLLLSLAGVVLIVVLNRFKAPDQPN
jgi:putative membrane protein